LLLGNDFLGLFELKLDYSTEKFKLSKRNT